MELKIEHLSKRFKDKTAVDDVSLTLTSGVWGLLGANGAGKTTLMRMIADIMVPTNGAIYYDGKDIHKMGKAYRELFGFLPQDFGYFRDFTVKDYLEYMAALKDVPARETSRKINHLLDILTLSDVKRKKIAKLSGWNSASPDLSLDLLHQFVCCTYINNFSIFHNRVSCCNILNVRNNMCGDQHNTVMGKLGNKITKAYPFSGVKSCGRFIHY